MTNEEKIKNMPTSPLAMTLAEHTWYTSGGYTFYTSPYDCDLDLDQAEVQWKKWLEEEAE